MRPPIGRHLLLAVLLTACGATFARTKAAVSQAVPAEQAARAVSTVMDYRRTWMDDPLPFETCSVRRALGGTDDFAAQLAPQVRSLLDNVEAPCPRPAAPGRNLVHVDSVRLADPAVLVYVTVLRGELIHREIHELDPGTSGAYMGVRAVRLWGNVQIYPAYPRRDAQPER